jgi:alkanesulfonate monooxygenase SsuD/methylene tetrahydromethanopterin reductase-like flavin-dependent oxidoreductase (luciferase family)
MAAMMGKLYDAWLGAGASSEQAREAAEEVASFDERMQSIGRKLTRVETILLVVAGAALAIPVRVYWP